MGKKFLESGLRVMGACAIFWGGVMNQESMIGTFFLVILGYIAILISVDLHGK